MKKNAFYLITTADELTWKFGEPVLFLGSWCCSYDRKHIWKNMNYEIAEPYGLDKAIKDEDFNLAIKIQNKLLNILRNSLNYYHNIQGSERFWNILIGHWLQRYVHVMMNRINTLEAVFNTYSIKGTIAYSSDSYSLASNNSLEAIYSFSDDQWNSILYLRLISLLGFQNLSVEYNLEATDKKFSFDTFHHLSILSEMFKKQLFSLTKKIRERDGLIISSKLPPKKDAALKISLGQIPIKYEWSFPFYEEKNEANKEIRRQLTARATDPSECRMTKILVEMLFELLPICYLEGFKDLNKVVSEMPWPKTPRFIFTSNDFANNEVFKLWTAFKTQEGIKYIVGQHGNNYGTYRYLSPSIEEITSDKFLTWGWSDGLIQHVPSFILTHPTQTKKNYNSLGSLLLIEVHLEHRFTIWDATNEFTNYFKDQQKFVAELCSPSKEALIIRLHSATNLMGFGEKARWKDFDCSLTIDDGAKKLKKLINKSRLIIFSYDSTGFLETLSDNIPTIAFWQNGLDHVKDWAAPYYELLVEAEIIHFTPESAAKKVNEVWNDVDSWWMQDKVQSARATFSKFFAKKSKHPIVALKKILESI